MFSSSAIAAALGVLACLLQVAAAGIAAMLLLRLLLPLLLLRLLLRLPLCLLLRLLLHLLPKVPLVAKTGFEG